MRDGPHYPRFLTWWFQLSVVNVGPKILSEKSRNKQFISLKSRAILSSMMKSCPILLCLAQDVNYPCPGSPRFRHFLPGHHFVALSLGCQMDCQGIIVLVFKSSISYQIMAPQCESSDAGSSDVPKRCWKVLSLSEKTKVLDLNKERKKIVC